MNETEHPVRRFQDFRWQGVDLLAYKQEGEAPFQSITRQLLFHAPDLAGELRYFEIAPGGHSTLERHQHRHAVMILRGSGRCLVGDRVHAVEIHDLVEVPPQAWHQFRADAGQELGFLCLVNAARDKPILPDARELENLRSDPEIARFIRI